MSEELEARARKMGWLPKEDFQGDEDRWVDKDVFVERGENIMPILKERLSKFESDLDKKTAELDKVTKNLSNFAKHHKGTYRRAYDNAFKALEAQKREAVGAGDTDSYDALNQQIHDLQQELHELREVEVPQETQSPLFKNWLKDNPWYHTDEDLRMFTDALGANLQAMGAFDNDEDFYAELTRRAKLQSPHKFTNVAQHQPPTVEGEGLGTGEIKPGKKGWGDVPADAQKTYMEMFSDIEGFSKDDYARDYFEQFEEVE